MTADDQLLAYARQNALSLQEFSLLRKIMEEARAEERERLVRFQRDKENPDDHDDL